MFASVAVLAAIVASLFAYRIGFSRGVEAGLASGGEVEHVARGVAALSIIRHLEAGRSDEALAELDAQIDAGISAHWIRSQAPSHHADIVDSPDELIPYLEEYRRSRPSRARGQTPSMNRIVAESLAEQDER